MSSAWSNVNTTSLTLPTGATDPDQRITLDGASDTILVYDNTGALIASVAATAGTDGLGNNYPAGISASAGIISQSIILLYNGTPAAGNLVMSLTSMSGSDSFGNVFQAGYTVYDTTTGNAVRNIDVSGLDTIGESGQANFTINPTTGRIQFFSSTGLLTGTIDANTGALLFYTSTTTTSTFTASGSFVVPTNVQSLIVAARGGGGGGRSGTSSGSSGGGGGEYAQESALAVTPGETLTVTIGAGGTGGTPAVPTPPTAGGDTTLKRSATTLVIAHGGGAGQSGAASVGGTGSTNTIHHNGGLSPRSSAAVSTGGSGGGEGAGSTVTGNPGIVNSGTTGGAGGSGSSGGNGGAGGNGTGTSGTAGAAGNVAGGGGGSGGRGSTGGANGGAGARGQMDITYTNTATLEIAIAAMAGTDQFGNTYSQGITIGNASTSNIKFNPSTPSSIQQSFDANGNLALTFDATDGRMTFLDNVNLAFVQVNPATTAATNTDTGIAFGFISSAGSLPTATQLANAGRVGINGTGAATNVVSPIGSANTDQIVLKVTPPTFGGEGGLFIINTNSSDSATINLNNIDQGKGIVGSDFRTSNQTFAGTETVLQTTGTINFQNNRAYRVSIWGLLSAAADNYALLRVRKGTTAAGTIYKDQIRCNNLQASTSNAATSQSFILVNTSGADISTAVSLTGVQGGVAQTWTWAASAGNIATFIVEDVGSAFDWPGQPIS